MMHAAPGGPIDERPVYCLCGTSAVSGGPPGAILIGLMIAPANGVDPIAEVTVGASVEGMAAVIACIERSAATAGLTHALAAQLDQARALITDTTRGGTR